MSMKYSKAPVSEVILGISYRSNVLTVDQLMSISNYFKTEYPIVEILPPLVVEELVGFQVQQNLIPAFSGPMLVRRRTTDRKWLLQMQLNKLYLNWRRTDQEPVGDYVGYQTIKERLIGIIEEIKKVTGVDPYLMIELLDVTYHDRLVWTEYIDQLGKLNEIMAINVPPVFSADGYNNIFNKYTFKDSVLGGFGIIDINTATSVDDKQMIKFISRLRGYLPEKSLSEWFDLAHSKQINIFESVFVDSTKESWK